MRFIHRFPLLAYALVLLAIVGLCIAQQTVELLLVAGALAAMSWYVTEGPRGRHLPRWVSTVLIIGVAINFGAELLQGTAVWEAAVGRFAVWMTLIKLYERKTSRDYAQLLLLSLLLMMAGAVQSSQLLYGVVLVLYACLGLYVLLLFQLYVSNERARDERRELAPPAYRLVPPVKPVIGRHLGAQFRLLGVGIAALGLALSLILFVLFPRNLGTGIIPRLEPLGPSRRAGFVDRVDLHSSSRITSSRRAVLRLMLLDGNDRPVRLDRPIRLRGAVLDVYEGDGRWRRSGGRERLLAVGPELVASLAAAAPPSGGGLTQIVLPSLDERTLFSMRLPVSVQYEETARLWFDPIGRTMRRDGRASRAAYRIIAVPDASDELLQSLTGRALPRRAFRTRLDELTNEAIASLARQILANAGLPDAPMQEGGAEARYRWNERAAAAFVAHLQAYEYTTDLSDVQLAETRRDPIERFLLDTKRGHCEYFASGLAALCWNVRIPVRLVTGFVAWEYDETSEEYVVVESNAHAWSEVRTGPYRWSEVDPTPPATLRDLHRGEASLADRLGWFYQRFEGSWNEAVVTYDADAQGRLVQAIDRGWSERARLALAQATAWLQAVNRAFYFGPAGYIWMGVVAFALVLAVLVLIRLMRRSRTIHRQLDLRRVRGRSLQRMLRQLGFYIDMLDVLAAAGVAKPDSTPPLQHVEVLVERDPHAAEIARRLVGTFYAGRYGGLDLSRAQLREAGELVDELGRTLRAKR